MSNRVTWAPPGGEHPKRVRDSAKTSRRPPRGGCWKRLFLCGLEGDEGLCTSMPYWTHTLRWDLR